MLSNEEKKFKVSPFNGKAWRLRGDVKAVKIHRKIRDNNLKKLKRRKLTSVVSE